MLKYSNEIDFKILNHINHRISDDFTNYIWLKRNFQSKLHFVHYNSQVTRYVIAMDNSLLLCYFRVTRA